VSAAEIDERTAEIAHAWAHDHGHDHHHPDGEEGQ